MFSIRFAGRTVTARSLGLGGTSKIQGSPVTQAGTQLGDYRLVRRIGAGGMAEVFLAQKVGAEGFARTVAIKTILAHGAEEEAVNLFLDEARVASFLTHSAVVQTLDLGFENETLFIVMEYVQGPALSRILKDLKKAGRSLSPNIIAYVGAQVAGALDYAHRRAMTPGGQPLALVHRDISPQNIMLTRDGLVKLTDFGVARASTQTHRTKTGQVRGKASYMAPEQVRAKELDGRTDIFALGLVLYEALTSHRAYHRKTDIMAMRAILSEPVKPIEALNPSAPKDLARAIMKALEKKPDDRWPNAADLAGALTECHRSRAAPQIEEEIRSLIVELYGQGEIYDDSEGFAVESWQPTMANAGQEPKRLPGSGLSPRIKEMLGTPTSIPSQTRSDPVTPLSHAELGTPSSLSGMTPSDPSRTYATMGSQPSYGTMPFSEPNGTMLASQVRPPPSRVPKALMPVVFVLIGVAIGGAGFALLRADPPVQELPAPPTPGRAPKIEAKAAPKAEPEPAVEKAKARPAKAPAKVAEAPPPPPPKREPAPPPPDPAIDAKSFRARIDEALAEHRAKNNTEWVKKLESLKFDVMLNKNIDQEMQDTLRAAERASN
jgi:serine/threonine-protein kinase